MRLEFHLMKRSGVESATHRAIGSVYLGQIVVPKGFKYGKFGTTLDQSQKIFRNINPSLNVHKDRWMYLSKRQCLEFFEHLGNSYQKNKNDMSEDDRLNINNLMLDYSGEGDYVLHQYVQDSDDEKSRDVLIVRILR